MGQEPTGAAGAVLSFLAAFNRWARALTRRLRRVRVPVRGVVAVSFPLGGRLTRTDLRALRRLGLVPGIIGAQDPPPPAPPADPPADPKDPDPPVAGGDSDEIKKLRRESAGYRVKAKEEAEQREALEAKLKAYEDKDKSDLELALSRAETAERERDEARQATGDTNRELWRYRAAAKYSVPEDLVDLIGGDTEEETFERAERLGTRIASPAEPGRRAPPPSPPRGARRDPAEPSVDEQLAAAEKAGDWAAVARLSLAKQSTKE